MTGTTVIKYFYLFECHVKAAVGTVSYRFREPSVSIKVLQSERPCFILIWTCLYSVSDDVYSPTVCEPVSLFLCLFSYVVEFLGLRGFMYGQLRVPWVRSYTNVSEACLIIQSYRSAP